MTKKDWTVLFIRILGLYLIAMHIATFTVSTAKLVLAATETQEVARAAGQAYMWSGPFAAAMMLVIGVLLIAKANGVAAILLKTDE